MTKKSLILTLPYPPSVNNYYGRSRFGVYIKKPVKIYREKVLNIIQSSGLDFTFTGRLSLTVELFPPDKRKRDIDNPMKGLLDSLTEAGVYLDDSQIDFMSVKRSHKKKGGECLVTLTLIESSDLEKIWSFVLSIFNRIL